jgi:hypothetical protein
MAKLGSFGSSIIGCMIQTAMGFSLLDHVAAMRGRDCLQQAVTLRNGIDG